MMMVTFLFLPGSYLFDFSVTLSTCKDPVKLSKVAETTEIINTLIEPRQNLTTADNNTNRHYIICKAIIA